MTSGKKALIVLLIAVAAAMLAGASAIPAIVGSSRCGACHKAQYDSWGATAHVKSLDNLTEKERADQKCLACHSVGEGRDSAVGCESCHGGGRYYAVGHVMQDRELASMMGLSKPDSRTCLRCHQRERASMKPFDRLNAMEKIRHWGKPAK
jgi:hypothetical protein